MKKYQFFILFNRFVFFLVSDDATLDAEISAPEINSTCVYCDENGCYGCDITTAAPDDDLRCWAINGWADREGMDQWCMDNCFNPGAPFCPSTTSDGGGCDCNCNAGDDGCPRESTNFNSLGNIFGF